VSPQVGSLSSYRASAAKGSQWEATLNPAFVIAVWRKWWKWALPTGAFLALVVAAYIFFSFVPQYRAAALLQYEPQTPFLIYRLEDREGNFLATQMEIIRSPVVLEQVVGRSDIARLPEIKKQKDPLRYLRDSLDVRSVGRSQLFEIAFAGPDAQRAAQIVNAVVNAYFELREQKETERTQDVIDMLEHESGIRFQEVEDRFKMIGIC
jgi:uncharacterized protein involved in exopolysaccharide biosynthesis